MPWANLVSSSNSFRWRAWPRVTLSMPMSPVMIGNLSTMGGRSPLPRRLCATCWSRQTWGLGRSSCCTMGASRRRLADGCYVPCPPSLPCRASLPACGSVDWNLCVLTKCISMSLSNGWVIKLTCGNDVYYNCEHMTLVEKYVNIEGIVMGDHIALCSLVLPHPF